MKKIGIITLFTTLSLITSTKISNTNQVVETISLTDENLYKTEIISEKGWEKSDTVILLNEKSTIDGILWSPLASLYKSPILLSNQNKLPDEIK